MDRRCCDLLLNEHCKKLFVFLDNYGDETKNLELKWLLKVGTRLQRWRFETYRDIKSL